MDLYDLNFGSLGHFVRGERAAFSVDTINLPVAWDYIYQNRKLLLRVDQHGPIYAQAWPPSGIMLFRRESFQNYSSWLVWLRSDALECKAFTNFFRPTLAGPNPVAEPDEFNVVYRPAVATYTVQHEGIKCVTEIFVPSGIPAICQHIAVTNTRDKPITLLAIPVLRTYVNPAMLAPWDKPEWYLKTAFCRQEAIGFCTRLLSMNAQARDRRTVVLWSSPEDMTAAEISYEKFVGQGDFTAPQAVYDGSLRMSPDTAEPWGVYKDTNTLYGYPPVNAVQYDLQLKPGQTKGFRQVLALLESRDDGDMPSMEESRKVMVYLDDEVCRASKDKLSTAFEELVAARSISTPDAALDRYVNEWLPLQMAVCSVDRGWPCGMRGTRDAANDFAALVPLDAEFSRRIIELSFSCQRRDGWFPRQYSASGRRGKHDLRGHRDGGVWVIELLYEYLYYTKDFDLLGVRLPWLDSDEQDDILQHALQAVQFYLEDESIGEHGLCKIGEGDWLDSINLAGLEGRGESVTITNQVIISLVQMCEILRKLQALSMLSADRSDEFCRKYETKIEEFKKNLLAHALNSEGFFSSVFTDGGKWIFSDKDPDGLRRVYGPANWWSIISGTARGKLAEKLIKEMDFLRTDSGYRLFWPPLGEKPIEKVGRSASGDQPAGLWENGTAYNHGSHGFLGRALAVCGKGNLLYDVLQCLLPYDQTRHPIASVMTPPYAMVNCWQEVPLFKYRGGATFLTGAIAYGLRMAYSWMFGIRPTLDGLTIDPCVPASFDTLTATFKYLDKKVKLKIYNPDGRECGPRIAKLNGKRIDSRVSCPFSGRELPFIADGLFTKRDNKIEVTL